MIKEYLRICAKSKKREKRRFRTSINDNSTPLVHFNNQFHSQGCAQPVDSLGRGARGWIYQGGEGGVPIASSCTGV